MKKSKILNYENYFVIAIHCQACVVNKIYLFGLSETVILIISEFSKTYSGMKNLWLPMKCKRLLFSSVTNLLIMRWNHWENLQFRITPYSIFEQKGETPLAFMTVQGVSMNFIWLLHIKCNSILAKAHMTNCCSLFVAQSLPKKEWSHLVSSQYQLRGKARH